MSTNATPLETFISRQRALRRRIEHDNTYCDMKDFSLQCAALANDFLFLSETERKVAFMAVFQPQHTYM